MAILDSRHQHDHMVAKLATYDPLTSHGSYRIVFDKVDEDLPEAAFLDCFWGKDDNSRIATWEYLPRLQKEHHLAADGRRLALEINSALKSKLLTSAPDGYLRRV